MVRSAEIKDIDRIAEIHIYGWRYAYREIISDEYLFSKLLVGKRIESLKKSFAESNDETYVYESNNIIKAFMTIGKCRNEDKRDSFELWGIYVEPVFKGKGIGREMIEFCEVTGKERGYKENVLWVFEKNTESRKFYERMGYTHFRQFVSKNGDQA